MDDWLNAQELDFNLILVLDGGYAGLLLWLKS